MQKPIIHINLIAEAESAFRQKRYQDVIKLLNGLTQQTARSYELLGYAYGHLNNLKETEKHLLAASKKIDCSIEVFYYLGKLYFDLDKILNAIKYLKIAIAKHSNFFEAHFLIGTALVKENKYTLALDHFFLALKLNSNSPDLLFNIGNTYFELGNVEKAIQYYEYCLDLNKYHHNAMMNFGVLYSQTGKVVKAIEYFGNVLKISNVPASTLADAYSGIGIAFTQLGKFEEAEKHLKKSLTLNPTLIESFYGLGSLYDQTNHTELAYQCYKKAYQINPEVDYIIGRYAISKQKNADWSDLKVLLKKIEKKILFKKDVIEPLDLLYVSDDPKLQFESTKNTIQHRFSKIWLPNFTEHKVSSNKIRVGYISPDFKTHAVAHLTAELFELHDRNTFEVIGISIKSHHTENVMRERIIKACDDFHDLDESMPDEELLNYCRNLELDIAIDLAGHTLNGRPILFKYRIAPIQINYLGYLGSLGIENMDYIIADKQIIPERISSYFYEKIIFLPECFQVNDSKRPKPIKKITRNELGLPEHGFIYACFNTRLKVTPVIFNAWIKILSSTTNTFLWMISESPESDDRLRKKVAQENIHPDRIVFTKILPFEDYLAGYANADLILDTFPYNGGTTTSDALWMGVPVLTLCGNSMPSRMGSSLLNSCGLNELVTETVDHYINVAIKIGSSKELHRYFLAIVERNIHSTPLFNSPRTVQLIESGYQEAVRAYIEGDTLKNIEVKPI